ncbi:MAG: SpoIIE family protein phosphatase [Desulfobacterales bacterium]|nr:SpoIIE family protein phosphatase [Desulfobacterales bacterium]
MRFKFFRIQNFSIKYKFIIGIVIILVIAMLSVSIVFIKRSERLLVYALEDKANLINRNFSIVSAKSIEECAFSNLQMLINEVAVKDREIKTLIVADHKGTIIATSDNNNYPLFAKIENETILHQLRMRQDIILRNLKENVLESVLLMYDRPDDSVKNLIGFIYISLNMSYLEKSISNLWFDSFILTIILMGFGIICAYIFGAKMAKPIRILANRVQTIASGNLEISIKAKTKDEIGQLITDVEKMRLAIKNLTGNLEEQVKERTAQLENAYIEINSLNERLKAENVRMSAELDVTRRLQQMMLPTKHELKKIKYLDIAGFMDPAAEVGGDYYDIFQTDEHLAISIGDVTGHGLESGVLMLMAQTAVRTLTLSKETDLKFFLNILNETLFTNTKRMKVDKSMTLAILEYRNGNIRISGQHEDVIIIRKNGYIEILDTMKLGFPLGLEKDIYHLISDTEFFLNAGDGVVLFTDGIIEAENISGKLYGIDRLCSIAKKNWNKSAELIQKAIIDDVYQYIGKQIVHDDLTLIVIKQI